jgi:tetratricopeptide (TPR) repeat protein
MKYFLLIIVALFIVNVASAQRIDQKLTKIQTTSQLALSYYNAKDYEKAIPLLLEVYEASRNSTYFKYYLTCLIELDRLEEAQDQIRREIRKRKTPRPEFYVHWGYLFKIQEKTEESQEKYQQAIELIPSTKGHFLITANAFIQWGEYDYAEKTYLKGREVIPEERFNYELARVYLYNRNYDKMMEEYLDLLRTNENQLSRIQSSLTAAMRLDIDDGLRNKFRSQVLKRIQAEPNVITYNRLLIWFFLQEKKFSSALRQLIALDRRTANEGLQIVRLGNMAVNNKDYDVAQKAYEFLIGKGEDSPYFMHAYMQNIHASYQKFIAEEQKDLASGRNLKELFDKGLEYLGYSEGTLQMIKEYAHLLAFYLGETDVAISILETGIAIPRLKPEKLGELKTELADIYVYDNDPWEATLIYSQVIDANKTNTLGDRVKLKKAKLGYYLGNFSWAKAQLDVLKASTSKLTANDAMELSLLIGNNLNLDTTAVPLQMFARADLLFFRNKDSLAMATLDSLAELYPYHTLVDDILFRKSKIEINRQNYAEAAVHLEKIVSDFSYDLLADDALYALAEIYNYNLDNKEKAKELYKEMLTRHPGSVFIDESRNKYRELREMYPDKETEPDFSKENLFMKAIENNEFD